MKTILQQTRENISKKVLTIDVDELIEYLEGNVNWLKYNINTLKNEDTHNPKKMNEKCPKCGRRTLKLSDGDHIETITNCQNKNCNYYCSSS